MAIDLNETHDATRSSWVASAAAKATEFPLQNLPFCVFRRAPGAPAAVGVGIGDSILDLAAVLRAGLVSAPQELVHAASAARLNPLMALPRAELSALRSTVFALLDASCSAAVQQRTRSHLVSIADTQLLLPVEIGDYTDFLTSAWHTERHGRFKGLQDPLPKAFFSLPVAYHGRASSICVGGTGFHRPWGQVRSGDGAPQFRPSAAMDFELELAAYIGQGNAQGSRIDVRSAGEHLFGFCLLNDWSAKDIQWWEQVLGPFLGKSFMTMVSPWVVTAEALAPFRAPLDERPPGAAPVLAHLRGDGSTVDVAMEAWLQSAAMRQQGRAAVRLSRTSPRHLSWSFEQMVAHHSSNGCNLRTGDLLGSGTVSGESAEAMGCMTEMTAAGTVPVTLPHGEGRHWLEDGDEVVFQARASRDGFVSIGFGECRGRLLPALS
ncbi:MAG TPA: fumarylacetoacetase [Pseudorhodoferax sp.]|nr:fumarylacetoacetase [Pseudorhodoferax sp.]